MVGLDTTPLETLRVVSRALYEMLQIGGCEFLGYASLNAIANCGHSIVNITVIYIFLYLEQN